MADMDLFGPLVTGDGISVDPLHVTAVVAAAVVIGLIGVGLRRLLMAAVDELALLWREHAPAVSRTALGRRSMPATPWFCARCMSQNSVAAGVCYACGGRREEAELVVLDAEAPAGPSAGLANRTRRHG